ncbi:ras-related protein rab-5c [Anaeramoeba flamelloides]|uniref:Ras-related protein rab-5c n=1 Tax=Anaeramoeba flamelloides TaxID=1746091 RepID=A0AAV7ZMP3_9EUKA|nr:ras-related protein rab-5c [Anaeramoeba flamelloides]
MCSIFSVGYNYYGQLGIGSTTNQNVPQKIQTFLIDPQKLSILRQEQLKISCGEFHSVVYSKHLLFTFGSGTQYQLGNGTPLNTPIPFSLPIETFLKQNDTIKQVACGARSTLLLTDNDHLYHFGSKGGPTSKNWLKFNKTPTEIQRFVKSSIKEISAGGWHYMVLEENGKVYSWGYGKQGQLGQGKKNVNIAEPKLIKFFEDIKITNISCGHHHSAAISSNGKIFTWGCIKAGRLLFEVENMTFETAYQYIPYEIETNIKFINIKCGYYATYAIDLDGKIYSGGRSITLGRNVNNDSSKLVCLEGFCKKKENVCKISTLSWSCCVSTIQKNAYAFGYNKSGQLGIGNNIHQKYPQKVKIPKGYKIIDIASGSAHTMFVAIEDKTNTENEKNETKIKKEEGKLEDLQNNSDSQENEDEIKQQKEFKKIKKIKKNDPGRTRTYNLLVRSQTRCHCATKPVMSKKSSTIQFKIVLLGESAVGKSSLVWRFCQDQFSETIESTVGATFIHRVLDLGEYSIKLQIWDTAGQERYHSLTPMYYRGAKGVIITYDVTNLDSYERAKDWVKEIRTQGSPNAKIAIVANKIDLEDHKVDQMEAMKYAESNDLLYFETSAKTGEGVKDVFFGLSKALPVEWGEVKKKTGVEFSDSEDEFGVNVKNSKKVNKKKEGGGCC